MVKMTKNTPCKYRSGLPARIICDDNVGDYPVVSVDECGNLIKHDRNGRYAFGNGDSKYDLILIGKYEGFNVDDKVLVSNDGGEYWLRRYFSHEKDGIAYCFDDGTTNWSVFRGTSAWNQCKKWDGE